MIEYRLLTLAYKHLNHFKEEDEMVTKTMYLIHFSKTYGGPPTKLP